MCGIFCMISRDEDAEENYWKTCEDYIKRRGPDVCCTCLHTYDDKRIFMAASVLWLQGTSVTKQPLNDDTSMFVYNGDMYKDNSQLIDEQIRRLNIGDTMLFKEKLDNSLDDLEKVVDVLTNVEGPYSFIYHRKQSNKIYFGRDVYGRKSLLVGNQENCLIITSVGCKGIDFIELPAIGTYSYDLYTSALVLYPWTKGHDLYESFQVKTSELSKRFRFTVSERFATSLTKLMEPLICHDEGDALVKCLINVNFEDGIETLLKEPSWSRRVERVNELLLESVRKRVLNQPSHLTNCLGVLFSGGLDCTVLALLAHKCLPISTKIELINVSFDVRTNYNSPDRLTGLESYLELVRLAPERTWNFVTVNVPCEELDTMRGDRIKHLVHPLTSILDDSLGCVLWFAARRNERSNARVLLIGSGADELFGGYTKHRAALKRDGWNGLEETLRNDWRNIAVRNLGRDDRVVSDHGRQLRIPYLDEGLVDYLVALKAWQKTLPVDGLLRTGIGEKILLRLLAYKLGLRCVAKFKKRAMQFGTRIANKKENANEPSPRLLH